MRRALPSRSATAERDEIVQVDSVDPAQFREAISLFATGVTVITTQPESGPAGMTASAVCSLSVEPVQLLVCISSHLPTHAALTESGRFVVNVLGEGQAALALHFARPSEDKFASVAVDHSDGVPILRDAIAHFVCDVSECFPGGDHSIFIGEVVKLGLRPGSRPLLYFAKQFGALADPNDVLLKAWLDRGGL
jgi:flavin reductase (DIM6/NTAB) family NADH-FMN oxidoreductase RutF